MTWQPPTDPESNPRKPFYGPPRPQLSRRTEMRIIQWSAGLCALVILVVLWFLAGWGAVAYGVGLVLVTLLWCAADVAKAGSDGGEHRR